MDPMRCESPVTAFGHVGVDTWVPTWRETEPHEAPEHGSRTTKSGDLTMEGAPQNPFAPDNRGLFTLSAIWHFDPRREARSTCPLSESGAPHANPQRTLERGRIPEVSPRRPVERGRIREVRTLCDLRARPAWENEVGAGISFSSPS